MPAYPKTIDDICFQCRHYGWHRRSNKSWLYCCKKLQWFDEIAWEPAELMKKIWERTCEDFEK